MIRRPTKKEQLAKQNEAKLKELEKELVASDTDKSVSSFETSVDFSFFYNNDKQIKQIDDNEIISKIIKKFPEFNQQQKDIILKKIFIQIINNKEFMNDLFKYYDITIYDFIKIIYKQYSSIFAGQFIVKVRNVLAKHKYPVRYRN